MSDSQEGSICSWGDVFGACGRERARMSAMEDDIRAWYLLMYGDAGVSEANGRHDRHFWDAESKVGTSMVRRACKCAVWALCVGFVLAFVLRLFHDQVSSVPVLGWLASSAPLDSGALTSPCLIWYALVSLVLGVLSALGSLVFDFVRKSSLERRIASAEDALAEVVSYLPPKYRNAFCLDAFFDMWSTYGVGDITQAIDVCDDHIARNRDFYVPIQVMADVPYVGAGGGVAHFSAKAEDWENPDTSDPALPEDIASHVSTGVEDAEEALDELIGLDAVKTQVRQMRNRIDFYGDKTSLSANHLLFLGAPGTGKSTVARIVCRILYDYGYIHANRIVEVDGDYLKSPYAGQTGARTQAVVNYAMGGVLFIDEAYLLYDDKATSSAGNEATGVLLKAMEDRKDDIVVILAGYEDPMMRLIASNEGFSSRIRRKIYFDTYSTDDLCRILELFLSKVSTTDSYRISPDAMAVVAAEFGVERTRTGFGNARAVRNAVDALLDIHADRFVQGLSQGRDKFEIDVDDAEAWVAHQRKLSAEDDRNLMATLHVDQAIINTAELKEHTHTGSATPDADLAALVGLKGVKREMEALKAQSAFYGGHAASVGHAAFLGPAGTGKSTMAAIYTGYLHDMGYIRENRYLDITGDFLRGGFVGHTGKRTQATIEYATGGVLFIDEAYLLRSSDQGDSFGTEAIGTLVDAMEKRRDSLVVILAGYTDAMNDLFAANEGLRSRISTVFTFEPYTLNQLCQIFRSMAWAEGFTCDDALFRPLALKVRPSMSDPLFGNARVMRELLAKVERAHIMRFSRGVYGSQDESNPLRMTLLADDLAEVE